MALSHSPSIVTDGLVLYLDAANRKSYPGSGATLSDINVTTNACTLLNGPVYSSDNLGIIKFDGANDYAEIQVRNTELEFQPTQPFSVFCWMYGNFNGNSILSNMLNSGSFPGWDIWKNSASTISMHLINTWSSNAIKVTINFSYSNNWQYVGYTYDGSSPTTTNSSLNSVNFYVNGILSTSGKTMSDGTDGFNSSSETITYNSDQRFRLASRWVSGSGSSVSSVWLGPVQVYRRAISALEIQQNFNALRGRFGI